MVQRKAIVKQTAADNIAAIAWFIESKGLIATADKFTDEVYDFFVKLSDKRKSYSICKEPKELHWDINASLTKRNIPSYLLKEKMK